MSEKSLIAIKNSVETELRALLEDTRKKCEKQMADPSLVNVVLMKVATENATALKTENEKQNLVLQILKISKYNYDLLIDDITANVMAEYLSKPINTSNNTKKEDSMNEKLLLFNKIESEFRILLADTLKSCKNQNIDETFIGLSIANAVAEYSNKLKSESNHLIEMLQILQINKNEYDIQIDNITTKVLEEYLEESTADINSNNKKEGCYIATSIYGSYEASEVLVLRSFRDNYLEKFIFGRLFIKIYYLTSPTLVKLTKNKKNLNVLIKKALDRFVLIIKNSN